MIVWVVGERERRAKEPRYVHWENGREGRARGIELRRHGTGVNVWGARGKGSTRRCQDATVGRRLGVVSERRRCAAAEGRQGQGDGRCRDVTAERRPEAATERSQGLAVVEWSRGVAAARRQAAVAER